MTKLTPIAASLLALSSFNSFADGAIFGAVLDQSGALSGAKITVVGTTMQTGEFNRKCQGSNHGRSGRCRLHASWHYDGHEYAKRS